MPTLTKLTGGSAAHVEDTFIAVGPEDAEVGKMLGPALPADKVTDAIDQLVEVYLRERQDGERFLDTYRRTGMAPFKEAVYADVH